MYDVCRTLTSIPNSSLKSFPPCQSLPQTGSVERIAVGGKPNRRAAPANTAPFCIQPFTCSPCWVKELSGLTRSLQGEFNANEILLHISFQSGSVVSCPGVKLLLPCPELPFHSAAQALSLAKI